MSRRGVVPQWPTWQLVDSRQKLCELRESLEQLPRDVSEDVQTHLSRFLVIRACGHIEYSLDQATSSFVARKASPDVHKYIEASLFRGQNPAPGRLIEKMSRFSNQWGAQLTEKLDENDGLLRRELEFLVDRRNRIAHGQSEGISRSKALMLCGYALEITDEILRMMSPTPPNTTVT